MSVVVVGLRVRSLLPVLAAVALTLVMVAPVFAHAELDTSDPEDEAELATPPTVVTLTFTEGLDAGKSSLTLDGPGGEVGVAKPAKDGSTTMRLQDLVLAPGAYTIAWTAAADDGHIERGTLSFTVLGPTPPPATPTTPPTEAPSASTAAPTTESTLAPAPTADAAPSPGDGDGEPAASTGDIVLPIVVGLALAGLVGVLVLRRGRAA